MYYVTPSASAFRVLINSELCYFKMSRLGPMTRSQRYMFGPKTIGAFFRKEFRARDVFH